MAGLKSFTDFIMSQNDYDGVNQFNDILSFHNFMLRNKGKVIDLLVYNIEEMKQRAIQIKPRKWRGVGIVGCSLGEGYVHEISRVFRQRNEMKK